jgi:deoxyhypusine synthase
MSANPAESVVLQPSAPVPSTAVDVRGPSGAEVGLADLVDRLATTGFQASNLARAVDICKAMLRHRNKIEADESNETPSDESRCTIFLGCTANLLGTGVRESLRFLCKHKLVDALVVSGGAVEHDIRRALTEYHLGEYASEESAASAAVPSATSPRRGASSRDTDEAACRKVPEEQLHANRFGNVRYTKHDATFSAVMTAVMGCIDAAQRDAQELAEGVAVAPIPATKQRLKEEFEDVCTWAFAPSRVWREIGLLLPTILTDQSAAASTVVYWCARNNIPIYSPSFTDGDVMMYLLPSTKIDLVADIKALNRSAMKARRSGMIVLGGGVVKHHVCNANLMRNGADHAVYINTAQEFDGSDGGARPDEAVSWGKIRTGAQATKVYADATVVFPLIVAAAFFPAAAAEPPVFADEL